jgi:hypothetical protein
MLQDIIRSNGLVGLLLARWPRGRRFDSEWCRQFLVVAVSDPRAILSRVERISLAHQWLWPRAGDIPPVRGNIDRLPRAIDILSNWRNIEWVLVYL